MRNHSLVPSHTNSPLCTIGNQAEHLPQRECEHLCTIFKTRFMRIVYCHLQTFIQYEAKYLSAAPSILQGAHLLWQRLLHFFARL